MINDIDCDDIDYDDIDCDDIDDYEYPYNHINRSNCNINSLLI